MGQIRVVCLYADEPVRMRRCRHSDCADFRSERIFRTGQTRPSRRPKIQNITPRLSDGKRAEVTGKLDGKRFVYLDGARFEIAENSSENSSEIRP